MDKKIMVSDSELEILEVLWAAENPLNAADIRNALNEHKSWERTTVLTLIQRLVKKGAVSQEKTRGILLQPLHCARGVCAGRNQKLYRQIFKGSPKNLAAALVDSDTLTKKDIEELRDYFNRKL